MFFIGLARQIQKCLHHSSKFLPIQYIQGQSPDPGVREYFYFINHQGMVSITISKCVVRPNVILS